MEAVVEQFKVGYPFFGFFLLVVDLEFGVKGFEIGFFILVNGPFSVGELQGGEAFYPVAGVEVDDGFAGFCSDLSHLRNMDMAAKDVIVVLFAGQFDGGIFKIRDEFDRFFYAELDLAGKGHAGVPQGGSDLVDPAVEHDEPVVTFAAQARDEGREFDGSVENVAVEYPIFVVVQPQEEFVAQADIASMKIGIAAKGIVVIAGDVVDFRTLGGHAQDALDDLEVFFGEVAFSEFPDIYEIAVKDQGGGLDAFKIVEQFFGVTAVGS